MAHQTIHIALLVFALSALSSPAVAQAKSQRDRTTGTPRTESSQAQKRESKRENGSSGSSPVTLATPPPADFLSGEANVAVSGNQNPVIRLGLSPNGATIIEFPASDKLFNIIPGNSNLVTVEESPTKETDRFIIVRPGDGFASPATMANARRAAPHDAGTEARRRSRVEGAEQMIQKNFSKPSIDPREVIEREGVDALAELLASAGHVIQRRILVDLAHALRSRKPLLIEGPRGGGKTALAESLAQGCNLTSFYLQGMDELNIADVLYSWDREAQTQMVRQELAAGSSLSEAQAKQFSREYLILGEALAAFNYADMYFDPPVLILDEADKLTEKIEDMLLQLLGRGCAHVPRFGNVGVSDRSRWPIVILLSNDIRHDLSSPLRSRCLYTWLDAPTPREEVRILHARAPLASHGLVGGVTRLINCVRRDMPAVRDRPGLRESIDLLEALARDGVRSLTAEVIDQYLCFLGKRHKELLNLRQGLARLETAAHRADDEIDEWVERAFANEAHALEEEA